MRFAHKAKEQFVKEIQKLRPKIIEINKSGNHNNEIEEKLRESKERYRALFDRSLLCVYVHDLKGNFQDANQAALDLLGYTKEDIPSLNFASLLEKDQLVKAFENLEEIIRTGSQKKPSEFKLRRKDGKYVWAETEACLLYRNGKPYAVQGIARDITERKKAEEALKESEEKFRSIGSSALEAIIMIDNMGNISFWNDAAEKIFGYEKEEAIGKHMKIIIPEEFYEAYRKGFSRFKKTGKGPIVEKTRELTARRKDGTEFPLELSLSSVKIKNKWHAVGIVRDITTRKQSDEALRESEEKFRSVVEYSHEGIVILDDAFNLVYVNDELCRMSGYSREEIVGHDFRIFLDKSSKKLVADRYIRRQRGDKVPPHYEFTIVRKDGEKRRVEVSSAVIRDSAGRVNTVAQILDVTDRKHAEKVLLESEKRFKELWDNAPTAYHTVDTKGIITSVNQTEAKMLGYKPEEMVGKSIFEFILKEQQPEARKRFQKKMSGKRVPRAEDRIYLKKDGSKLYVVIDDVLERNGKGNVIGARSTMVDITEVKRAERLLRQSEERYRILAENAVDGIYIISPEGFKYVNPAFENIFGYKAKEVCSDDFNFFNLIHPEDRMLVKEREEARKKGKKLPPVYSFRILTKEGKEKNVEVNTVPLPGEKVRVLGILRDITKRTRAEKALKESEERYKTLAKTSPDAVTVTDLEGNITDVSHRTRELHGYKDAKELIGKSAFELIAPEQHEKAMSNLKRTLKEGVVRDLEYTLLRRDGTRFVGELNCALIKDADGNPKMFIATTRDITERQRAKKVIRESKERYRDLVEKAGIAIVVDDKDANVKYSNKKYAELFGYTTEEMEKQTIKTLVHPHDIGRVLKYHKGRIQGKKVPSRYECRGIRKDGSIINIEIDAVALKEGGKIIGTRSYIWDITERKKAEETIQISEDKFKTLFNNASDAIFIHDLGGHFLEVNQVACERLGYSREELLKMSLNDLDTPKMTTIVPARNEELDQRGHIFYETVHKHRDGTVIPIELSSRIIEYNGEPVALSIARDITERKRAEEERKQSFERLQKALEETVNALASAVEMRDPYTAGHQHRVTKLACAIAKEMGLSKEKIEGIRMAGVIHDVGKIRVPAEILSWPDRLDEIDFNVIKTHPKVGYDILKKIEFPYSVAQIMLQHHERLDGSGYPAGLKGEEILLEARILAVADVVEAMASHRPYRPALGIEKALEEITKNKGILYDPDVVHACVELFTKKKFKFK